jgi:hypothetical protein
LFGNTEEQLRLISLGCKQRGDPSDPPLSHATGIGYVRERTGDYTDALQVKLNYVGIVLVEASGGLCPFMQAALKKRHKSTKRKGATDRTRYSHHPANPHSHMRHHAARISTGVVKAQGANIIDECKNLKAMLSA